MQGVNRLLLFLYCCHPQPVNENDSRPETVTRIFPACLVFGSASWYPNSVTRNSLREFALTGATCPVKKIAILPTLLTLGNGVCGFAAIAYASKIGPNSPPSEMDHYF